MLLFLLSVFNDYREVRLYLGGIGQNSFQCLKGFLRIGFPQNQEDLRFFRQLCQAIVEGIEIISVIRGEFQLPGEVVMNLRHCKMLIGIDGDLFHVIPLR